MGCIRERDAAGQLHVISRLPAHPNPRHVNSGGEPTCILPEVMAELTCSPLRLPDHPDESIIYVGEARTTPSGDPFVRAIWFTPSTADSVSGNPVGTHSYAAHELYRQWCENGSPLMRSDATQSAAGLYTELGAGILAGTGRTSLVVNGTGTSVPFARNTKMSSVMEPPLTEFMSSVSSVMHHAVGEHVCAPHKIPRGCPAYVARAYQYPTLHPGTPPLMSHQVVVRGPATNGDVDALMSVSDLHIDACDGGNPLGSCTIHTCSPSCHTLPEPSPRHLALRGQAVFPTREGGRGVHVHSMVPGWHCLLIMCTNLRLHGSVVPGSCTEDGCALDPGEIDGYGLPNLDLMRVVTYPLRKIENLLQRLANDPEKATDIERVSDQGMQRRMLLAKMNVL